MDYDAMRQANKIVQNIIKFPGKLFDLTIQTLWDKSYYNGILLN